MSLADFLYRCPRCGVHPMEGGRSEGDAVCAHGCGRTYHHEGRRRAVRVRDPDGGTELATAAELARSVEALGGPVTSDRDSSVPAHGGDAPPTGGPGGSADRADGPLSPDAGIGSSSGEGDPADGASETARVRMRIASHEAPIRLRGRLLGFYERFGRYSRGRLELTRDALRFEPEGGSGDVKCWRLAELRALQSSSSAVLVSPPEGGVVLFKFPDDSSRRWERLVAAALRRTWQEAGRGEILEFQPRILGAKELRR